MVESSRIKCIYKRERELCYYNISDCHHSRFEIMDADDRFTCEDFNKVVATISEAEWEAIERGEDGN